MELTATASGYDESAVGFSIIEASLFSCVADISNPESMKLCGCLNQNDGSGLTWYADGSQQGKLTDWCSALDVGCSITNGSSLNAFNKNGHCGYSDWHLPTLATPSISNTFENAGGNWGDIGTYAINSNTYTSKGDFGYWLNSNRFNNVAAKGSTGLYWSAGSGDVFAWSLNVKTGVLSNVYSVVNIEGILMVRGGR